MDEDNELLLFDRVNVIKDTITEHGEDNFYLSFSGGKDSTILHYLLDEALPNNKIPRVYINTGIEYKMVEDFVVKMAAKDKRIIIIKPKNNIRKTLENYGYPFKSKEHSKLVDMYQRHKKECDTKINEIEKDENLKDDWEYIHNLPIGTKAIVKYLYGLRERERAIYKYASCP